MHQFSHFVFAAALLAPMAAMAAEPAAGRASLPQGQPYQRELRKFLATLKESDFQPDHQDLKVMPLPADADANLRLWILSLQPPAVGRKRNFSSVMIKPGQFTLEAIEGPQSIMRPPAHPEPLVDLADWNYPGNPYFGSRPLRLRAFVVAGIDLLMLDQLLDEPVQDDAQPPEKPNQNQLAGIIGRLAYVYPGIREVLPGEVRDAYLAGLRRLVRRALDNGPQMLSRTQGMQTWALPALALAAKVLDDPALTKEAQAYANTILTDPRFFRPAGYFPNGGTLDSFNGISTYFAVWGALASDSPTARDAIARVYRLRTHLTLPEPDGVLMGPSHMSALTSAEPAHEQWNWPMRTWGAALVTDEAACLAKMPAAADLEKAAALVVAEVNTQLRELSWTDGGLDPSPWKFQAVGSVVNFAYQYYPQGYAARRQALETRQDPVRLPVLRGEDFVRRFDDELLVAKTASHAAILHTGPIADSAPGAAHGLGGGALSAFWTPATGSVILGRGSGAYSPQYKTALDQWRSLPSHAVAGITESGLVFTSAHLVKPETTIQTSEKTYSVQVRGLLPPFRNGADQRLAGRIEYARTFESTPTGVRITTALQGDGKDQIAELYELLPIFLRDTSRQPKAIPTAIDFQTDGLWTATTEDFAEKVTAVRLQRFGGTVAIRFDRPCRVKLAPAWSDTYMSHAVCRNLLIDLREGQNRPAGLQQQKISYQIEAAAD